MEKQQKEMTVPSRKRSKESINSTQSGGPAVKKMKVVVPPVRESQGHEAKELEEGSPPQLVDQEEKEDEEVMVESQGSAVSATAASVKRRLPRNFYLKPQRISTGSWMANIASLLVHRCAERSNACGLDPRSHFNDINWSTMLDGLLRPHDLRLVWYFMRREYPEMSIPQIVETTRPYSELSVENLVREEIKVKYKESIPKPPLTAYMLFMKSKLAKLKQKYPNLQMTELAAKCGKKWSALSEDKKDKYKQQHTLLKASYEDALKSFYDEHPDARPPPKQPPPSRSKKVSKSTSAVDMETEEERKIKELKAQVPKQPLSAYLHFCKKKRVKLHRKYPELPPNAVTAKLGKRWQTMDQEARSKYVKLHEEGSKQYKEALAQFYSEHPGAMELLAKARKMKVKRKTRAPASTGKQTVLSVGEDGKLAATTSPHLSSSPSQTLTAGKENEMADPEPEEEDEERKEEEEQEEGEEEEVMENAQQQNGDGDEENSSDSDSSSED